MKKFILGILLAGALAAVSEQWYSFTNSVGLYTEERVVSGYLDGCTEFSPEQTSIMTFPDGNIKVRFTAYVRSSETNSAVTTVAVTQDEIIEAVGTNRLEEVTTILAELERDILVYKRSHP